MTNSPKSTNKNSLTDPLPIVGDLLKSLEQHGITTTLIGGMALIILGSQRVTKDADFLVSKNAREEKKLIEIFYQHGFELASKLNEMGEIVRTVDNCNVAFAKITIDEPVSIFFYNHTAKFRIDILFDFPLKSEEIYAHSTTFKIEGYKIHIASKEDLIKMKKIAYADRKKSTDLQDLEFLEKLK